MTRSRISIVVPVLSAAIALSACRGGDQPTAGETAPIAVESTVQSDQTSRQEDWSHLDIDIEAPLIGAPTVDVPEITLVGYAHLPADPEPAGPTQSIALLFMQHLQTGDWLNAARQLGLYGRDRLSRMDPAAAEAVMRDVATKAGGPRLGTCTSARRLHRDASVVRCGRVDVVVHTSTYPWRGILISAEHPKRDVLATPHTHAFTTLVQ